MGAKDVFGGIMIFLFVVVATAGVVGYAYITANSKSTLAMGMDTVAATAKREADRKKQLQKKK